MEKSGRSNGNGYLFPTELDAEQKAEDAVTASEGWNKRRLSSLRLGCAMPGEAAKEYEFKPLSVFSSGQPSTDFRFEISRDGEWHEYQLLRAEAWSTHTLKFDEKKPGIRSVVTKTETRGPYSRQFTVYFVHTKTAFSVKGVSKRFSDFKLKREGQELDVKIRKAFKNFNFPFPPDKVFNAMKPEFVNERRKHLQRYLDEILATPDIARFQDLHEFLGIPEYNKEVQSEQAADVQRQHSKRREPSAERPETYLRGIETAKKDGDRRAEAQAFNSLGLVYCSQGLDSQGVQCLESALELAKVTDDTDGVRVVLGNLACAHNMMECSSIALEYLEECMQVVEGDGRAKADVMLKMALTWAANGDAHEAVEHCRRCLSFTREKGDAASEATCLLTMGTLYYDAGEVRQAVEAFERCLVLRRKARDKIGLAEALNKLGLTYCDIGYDLRAIGYLEQSLVICEDNADLHGQAACLQHLGNVFKMHKDNNLAVDFFQRCLAVRLKIEDLRGAAECHDSLGLVLYGLGRFQDAIRHYQEGLVLREKLDDQAGQSECHKSLGTAFIRLQDTSSAIAAFERCLEIQSKLNNNKGVVDALISLGLAHFKAGNNLQASVDRLEQALYLFRQLPPEDAAASSGRAVCLDHLGNVYSKMGKSEMAVAHYSKSLDVKRDIKDSTGEARCLVRIGLEYLSLNRLQEAFEHFLEALALFKELEDENGIAICYENLGDTYMKMGEIRDAIGAYEQCLPIKMDTWDRVGEAQCLDNLGLAHYSLGELAVAAEYYEQSMAIWKAEGEKHALMTCCESLGGVCFHMEEHLRSIECYVQFLTLSQEVGDGASDHEILMRLGLSNAAIGEYSVALEFLEEALSFYVELGDLTKRMVCLQHIGRLQGKAGNTEEAFKTLHQALKLWEETEDEQAIATCLQEIALLHYDEGDNESARKFLLRAQAKLRDSKDIDGLAACVMHLGSTYAAEGRHAEAISHFTQALKAGNEVPAWSSKVETLTLLGISQASVQPDVKEASSNYRDALQSFEAALELWKEKGNRAGEASILIRLADTHLLRMELDMALQTLKQSLELRQVLMDRRGESECLFKLGNVEAMTGKTKSGRERLRQSLALRRELEDEYGQAECMGAIGQLLQRDNEFEEAIDMHKSALDMRRKQDDVVGIAESLNNLAVCYGKTGRQDEAIEHLQECMQLMKDGNDEIRVSKCLLNLGACYADQSKFKEAITQFQNALQIAVRCADQEVEAACYCNLGSAFVSLKQMDNAHDKYETGLAILRKINDKRGEADCLHNIGAAYFNEGQTEAALKHFDEAFQINRSLKDAKGATMCLNSLKAAHIRLGDASRASQCVSLIQEYFPDEEIQSVTHQLEEELCEAEEEGDKAGQAELHVQLGDANDKLEHVCLHHYQSALALYQELKDEKGVEECHWKISQIQIAQADYEPALESIEKASVRFKTSEWRDGKVETVLHLALVLYHSAICHLSLNNYERAAEALEECIKLREECDDAAGVEEAHNQLGIVYSRLGDTRRAMFSLQRGAGGKFVQEEDAPGRVVGVTSLASTLMNIKRDEDARKSIAKHETMLSVYKTRGDLKSEANCFQILGQAYLETQQLHKAIDAFQSCGDIRSDLGDPAGMAAALKRKGCAMFLGGDMPKAIEDIQTYLRLVSDRGDRRVFLTKNFEESRKEEVDACCVLGRAYHLRGDLSMASESLKRALALSHESEDRAGEAKCLQAFGDFYKDLWALKKAAGHLERALSICIELEDKGGEAACLTKLGQLYHARGDASSCMKCLEEALALCKQSHLQATSEASCLMNIGDFHLAQGELSEAKAHFDRAQRLCKEQMDQTGEARALRGLSQANLLLGDAYVAIDELMEAMNIRKSLGDRMGEGECLRLLAEAYAAVGKLSTARKVADQAAQCAQDNGTVLEEARAEMLFGGIEAKRGNFREAMEHLNKARDMCAATMELAGSTAFLDPQLLGVCAAQLADVLVMAGDRVSAQHQYAQAARILQAAEDVSTLAKVQCDMALTYTVLPSAGVLGSPEVVAGEEGLQHVQASMAAREKAGHRLGIADCLRVEGTILCRRGDLQRGCRQLRQAMDRYKEIKLKLGVAETLMQLGFAHMNAPQGVVYFEQSLSIRREASDLAGEAQCLRALGDLHTYLGNTRAAIKCWQDKLNLNRELGHHDAVKMCLEHLCALFTRVEEYARVADCAQQLRDIAIQNEDVDGETKAMVLTGKSQLSMGNRLGALELLNEALVKCQDDPVQRSEQLLVREAEILDKLAQIHLANGDDALARRELDALDKLKKKLGKDMLRGVVSESAHKRHLRRKIFSLMP